MPIIARRIRMARTQRKMTQAELARKIGVPYQLIQRYEQRGANASIDRLMAIAHALNIDPQSLMPELVRPTPAAVALPAKLGFYGRPALSRIVDFDMQAKAICGAPSNAPNHLLWERWYAGIHPDDRARVDVEFARIHDPRDGVFNLQYRLVGWDGVERCIIDLGHMVFEGKRPVRLQGIMLDITDEPRTESASDRIKTVVESVMSRGKKIRSVAVMFAARECCFGDWIYYLVMAIT